jgi:hypothetical protein
MGRVSKAFPDRQFLRDLRSQYAYDAGRIILVADLLGDF